METNELSSSANKIEIIIARTKVVEKLQSVTNIYGYNL